MRAVSLLCQPTGTTTARPALPCARRHLCAPPTVHARRRVAVRRAAAGQRPDQPTSAAAPGVSQLTDELRLLETERDEAVKTAEECARTAVKLEEMVRLLETLALNKVQEGDDDGARRVLQEKASAAEVLSRTSDRATTNFALASKLAQKIGQQQAEIMGLLGQGGGTGQQQQDQQPASSSSSGFYSYSRDSSDSALHSSSSGRTPTTTTTTTSSSSSSSTPPTTAAPKSSPTAYPDYSSTTSSSGYAGAGAGAGSAGRYEPPWEQSLREARQRVEQAEAQAAAAGEAAGARARETIEEARERLRRQSLDSVTAARSRIRRSASDSIAEAQARIAAEDAAALAEVHKVIDRYKSGGYVTEAELDWAFAQLERRSWRG